MNAWLSDASTLPNQENVSFNGTIDPSMAFLQPNSAPQDPSQFQRMFNNGLARNVSPGFHTPNQVIPSKRPRPDDGMTMSPRPAPGGIAVSRSQTPQQVPFTNFQNPVNGTQFTASPAAFQHLQQQGGSANPTQSPVLQDFDQHGSQRMDTASPSPFSSAAPQVGSAMSPTRSDKGSRVNTPQNSNFVPGQAFPQGMAPQFSQSPAMTTGANPTAMQAMQAHHGNLPQGISPAAMAAQQQRLYQMQLQNQARQMQANNPALAGRPGVGMNNPAGNPSMAGMARPQQPIGRPGGQEAFLRSLQKFMMARNLPLDLNPHVGGRPVNLTQLYAIVIKSGGSKKITANNMWPVIAQQLQFPVMQYPGVAGELRDVFMKYLAPYEQALLSSQQKQLEQMQQNAAHRPPSGDLNGMQFQQPGVQQGQQFPGSPQVGAPMQGPGQPNAANGLVAPQQPRPKAAPPQQPQHRPSSSRQSQGPPASAADAAAQARPEVAADSKPDQQQDLRRPIDEEFKPMVLPDNRRHGPVVVDEVYQLGEDISRLKPNVPSFGELGVIDLHALNMSLKSGLHAEVRMALDTLTVISAEPMVQILLDNCDDLVDTLVDCAEEQADLLAEHTAEVSDVMLLPSYEETTRACRLEMSSLVDVPEFGSLDYELDRAADRLLCITTILRNFSFSEANFNALATPTVVKFISTIIRYLGTRHMFLRTHRNIMDFMKDIVTFLSNVAHNIHLPGRDEALSLLHFLLSFAPLPAPTPGPDGITFPPYNPSIHKYTPSAIDALAKLLARDDPNRMLYKELLAGDEPQAQELLTRAFGLAICTIPEQPRKPLVVAEMRKIFLMQGLLAADILAGLVDGSLARQWLESVDGFAVHLHRLCCLISTDRVPAHPRQMQMRNHVETDLQAYVSIFNRGISVLRRLVEKSKQEDPSAPLHYPSGVLPKRESLLGALLTPTLDRNVVEQLVMYAGLGD